MNPTTDRLPTPSSPLPSATASVPSARKHPFHPDPASGRAAFFLCSTCLLVASAPREAQPYARCEDLRQQLVHHTHRQQPVSRLAARYEEECGRSWPERAGLRPRWTGSGRSSSTTLCAVWEKQLSTLGHLGIRAKGHETRREHDERAGLRLPRHPLPADALFDNFNFRWIRFTHVLLYRSCPLSTTGPDSFRLPGPRLRADIRDNPARTPASNLRI